MSRRNITIITASVVCALLIAVFLTGIFFFGWFSGDIKNISVKVVYADETSDVFEISTRVETLREALEENKLISGEETEMGLFVKTVNDVTINEENEEWWCFTKDDEMLSSGVDDTYISNGDMYKITFTVGFDGDEEEKETEKSAFYEKYIDTDARNIAVMIDNDNDDARPQAGLDEAYLVYEITVEGGATRYMAVFKNDNTEKIGPVRSSRHYFLDYVLENNAVYTHFGWSPLAQNDIPALGINNINGIYDGSVFRREYEVTKDWHTAYTSMESIKNAATAKGYSLTSDKGNVFKYNEADTDITGMPAENVNLKYNGSYTTGYKYNPDTKLYTKTLNGIDYLAQNKKAVTAKNVIIQFAANYNLGDGSARQQVETVGNSNGYYLTNGQCVKINWSKSARGAKTVYTDESGKEITLNEGTTFVNIINSPSKVVIQ
ncbi:MAG: DUF3048 domain-containing protein [Clostridia bacterium]|nr:DUF3048 domain-containing protein [Clostridia bacterium]